jgi:glycolate oxidase
VSTSTISGPRGDRRTRRHQPGDLARGLPHHFYPPDPSSQIVCSIGGNVAENSGGAHCFKYGFTTNYVTGLEVVLSDGTVVELDRDDPGYDLLGAFVGSEGTLGVATRIRLRVVPVPESVRTLVAFFEDTRPRAMRSPRSSARDRARRDRDDGRLSIKAAEQATHAGYRLDAGAALIVELDGPCEECTARFEHADDAVQRSRRARRPGRAERGRARS